METGLVERVLRDLPGVLDCSVQDEGIAIVVHPEIDPQLMELRAQVKLAEIGERRPLLVVGGMSTGLADPPRAAAGRARRPFARRSPLSLAGFAVLVAGLITVVPIAGGGGKAPRLPTVAAPSFERLPVVDEPRAAIAAAAAVVGPVAPAVRLVGQVARVAPLPAAARAVAAPGAAVPMVTGPVADPPLHTVAVAKAGKGKGSDKVKAQAKLKGKAKAAKLLRPAGRGRR